jgi:hypothetical protein
MSDHEVELELLSEVRLFQVDSPQPSYDRSGP